MPLNYTYTHARANLAKILDEVSLNKEVVVISRRNSESVALISESELSGLLETAHLLRSPKNAQRLLESIKKAQEGEGTAQSVFDLRKEFGLEK